MLMFSGEKKEIEWLLILVSFYLNRESKGKIKATQFVDHPMVQAN